MLVTKLVSKMSCLSVRLFLVVGVRLLLVFVVATISALPTLWGTFVFDDTEAVVKNKDVISDRGWVETIQSAFRNDFWGANLTNIHSHKSFRPLTVLIYRLQFLAWGLNPFPFHVLSLILHSFNCGLVYLYIRKLLVHTIHTEKLANLEKLSFWTAILFSVHPIHTEPLGGIVGQADLWAAFVFLLAAYFLSFDHNLRNVVAIFVFSISIIGSLFKENGVMLVVLYIATDILRKQAKNFKYNLIRYFCLLLASTAYVAARIWYQNGPPKFQPHDNPAAFMETFLLRVVNITYVWMLNIYLLVNPSWLCYDWSMGCVRLIESIKDYRLYLVILFYVCSCRYIYIARKQRLYVIAAIISFVTFLPASNLIFTVGFVLAERNLYLPSLGFCLFLSYVFLSRKLNVYLVAITVLYSARSFQRSFEWNTQETLFKSGLQVCPTNAKIHYNMGTLYANGLDVNDAISYYMKAIELHPTYYQAMNNLGNLYKDNISYHKAEFWLRKALDVKPDFATAWMNLGIVVSKYNKTEALNCYHNALKYRPLYPDCEYNLGNLHLDLGNHDLALKYWKRAVSLKPHHTQAWVNIAILLEQEQKFHEAKTLCMNASQFIGEEDTLHFILGNVYGKLSDFTNSEKSFLHAIALCEKKRKRVPAKYYVNLGVLYHRWNKLELAKKYYEDALKIDPKLASAQRNYESVKKLLQ